LTRQFNHNSKKEKIILSVGRFSSYFQTKKQEILIQAWKQAKKQKLFPDWTFILTGGLLSSDQEYFNSLQQQTVGTSMKLLPNIPFNELVALYKKASIYWHAAGFEQTDPKLMEHFGITTVEAMASGCVPIVYDAGGQREIVRHGIDGFLWKTFEELIEETMQIISDTRLRLQVSFEAIIRSADFDTQKFEKAFDELLERISV